MIHRADYRHDGATDDVAVKLFKGAMTSDGSPLYIVVDAPILGGSDFTLTTTCN